MIGTRQKIYIADVVTTFVILLGFISILYAPRNTTISCILLTLSGVLDSIDGLLARKYPSSDSGLVYDSIADIISFSLSPSIIIYYHIQEAILVSVFLSTLFLLATAIHMRRFMHTNELLGCPTTISALAVCQSILIDSPYLIAITIVIFSGAVLRRTEYTKDVDINIKIMAGLILISSVLVSYESLTYDFLLQSSSVMILAAYATVGGDIDSVRLF